MAKGYRIKYNYYENLTWRNNVQKELNNTPSLYYVWCAKKHYIGHRIRKNESEDGDYGKAGSGIKNPHHRPFRVSVSISVRALGQINQIA